MPPAHRQLTSILTAAALTGASAAAPGARAAQPAGRWSHPATLARCRATTPPRVVFPSNSPTSRTGLGAIVWGAERARCVTRAAGAIAAIAPSDAPGPPRRLPPPAAVAATGSGRIVVAELAAHQIRLTEAPASGPFAPPAPLIAATPPIAIARGYLGDVAVAVRSGSAIAFSRRRFYAHGFGDPVRLRLPRGTPTALTVALSYRSDAIVAWQQRGTIWARWLHADGRVEPAQRLGASPARPQIEALISDDNRAIVAWTVRQRRRTRILVSISGPRVRFARAHLLERFSDPRPLPDGSLRLTRLSTDGVLLAWTGMEHGRHVIRIAPLSVRTGVHRATTIAQRAADVMLSDLVPGPRGEALALWTAARRRSRTQWIFASRGIDAAPGIALFGPSEPIATAPAGSTPRAAFDPATDRAIAAWRTASGVAYAVRAPTARRAAPHKARRSHTSGARLAIAAALLLLVAAGARALRRRR